jgi:hypothetical protein
LRFDLGELVLCIQRVSFALVQSPFPCQERRKLRG